MDARRKTRRSGRVVGLAVALPLSLSLVLAACGGKAAPAAGGGGNGGAYGAGNGMGSGNGGKVSSASVAGLGTVLVAPSGFTLYHLTTEVNGQIKCTGSCATNWPPLVASSGKVPSATPGIAGHLGTVKRPDGSVQVTFGGMPLYTFAGDSGPGQGNGQGVGGVWFAVTATGSSATSSGPPGY